MITLAFTAYLKLGHLFIQTSFWRVFSSLVMHGEFWGVRERGEVNRDGDVYFRWALYVYPALYMEVYVNYCLSEYVYMVTFCRLPTIWVDVRQMWLVTCVWLVLRGHWGIEGQCLMRRIFNQKFKKMFMYICIVI